MGGKRLAEFDVLKGIGILLVVLGHTTISDPLKYMIYCFHMPLFVAVSGYFFHPKAPGAFLVKTFKRLMVLWAFFAFLNVLIDFAMQLVATRSVAGALSMTASSIVPLNEYCNLLYRSIWFLVMLFVCMNVYNCLTHYLSRLWLHVVVGLVYLTGFALQFVVNVPFFIDSALSVLLFYHVGAVIGAYNKETMQDFQQRHVSVPVFLGFCVAMAVLLYLAVFLKAFFSFKENIFPVWAPVLSLSLTGVLYFIVAWLCRRPAFRPIEGFLSRCGLYSLCILGFHRQFMDVFYIIFSRFQIQSAAIQTLIYLVVSIPLILLLSRLLERYAPVLIGMRR